SYIVGSPIWEDYAGNGLWSDVVNESTDGYELEMTINPTDNWRIMMNVSKNDALLSETFILTTPWYDQFVAPAKADWQAGTLDLENEFLYELPDVSIADTIREIDRKFAFHRAEVGGQTIRTNTWLMNLVTSYSFDRDSALKGFRIGGTLRYRDAPVVGFQEVDGEFRADLPFLGQSVFNTDIFVSYGAKSEFLGGGNWDLTFRIRNLTDEGPYYPNTAVDNGFGDPFYLQYIHMTPRSYELSGRYRF
ncbi:MAG: TonB-dependent receptor, partial [Verrucomicrobia bacterium]|nr:TonB-dependent receptor [Verrucomicrobiota bacterium]